MCDIFKLLCASGCVCEVCMYDFRVNVHMCDIFIHNLYLYNCYTFYILWAINLGWHFGKLLGWGCFMLN